MIDQRISWQQRSTAQEEILRLTAALADQLHFVLPALQAVAKKRAQLIVASSSNETADDDKETPDPHFEGDVASVRTAILQWPTIREPSGSAITRLADRLLGEQLGDEVAHAQADNATMRRVRALFERHDESLDAFERAFCMACQLSSDRGQAWLAELARFPQDPKDWFPAYDRHGTSRLAGPEQPRLRQAWTTYSNWFELAAPITEQLRLLRLLDLRTFLSAIDKAPSRRLAAAAFEAALIQWDRAAILQAISDAPPLFEESSGKWTQATTLLLALESTIGYLVAVDNGISRARRPGGTYIGAAERTGPPSLEAEAFRSTEAPSFLRLALERLLMRTDGRRAAVEWIIELGKRSSRTTQPQPKTAWDIVSSAFDTIVDSAVAHDFTVAEFARAASAAKMADPRTAVAGDLIAAAVVDHQRREGVGGAGSTTPDEIWTWYEHLLSDQDEGLSAQVNPYAATAPWVYLSLGSTLAATAEPISRWSAAWRACNGQRRSVLFDWSLTEMLAPSRHLLEVGNATIQFLLASEKFNMAKELWTHLANAGDQLFIGNGGFRLIDSTVPRARLFSHVPMLWSEDWRVAAQERASALRSDDRLCALAGWFLTKNGIALDQVRSVFAEIATDPLLAAQRLAAWVDRSGARNEKIAWTNIVTTLNGPS